MTETTNTATTTVTVLSSGAHHYELAQHHAHLKISDMAGVREDSRTSCWAFTMLYRGHILAEGFVRGENLEAGVSAAIAATLIAQQPTHRVPTLSAYQAVIDLAKLDAAGLEAAAR